MAKPQFADRTKWVTCSECQGRSFTDPTKVYHYPECSQYRGWRFPQTRGYKPLFTVPEYYISVRRICSHRQDGDWTACATCTDAADFDEGEDEG